jgi:serine/threonine protein kinase
LAYAIRGKHETVVSFLLSQDADPNSISSAGVSLLSLARDLEFDEGVTALRKSGAKSQADEIDDSSSMTRVLYDTPHFRYHRYDEVPFQLVGYEPKMGGSVGIYRVTHRDHPFDYLARKELPLYLDTSDQSYKKFRRGVDVIRALVHQHIIEIKATYEVSSNGLIEQFGFTMLPVGDGNLQMYLQDVQTRFDPVDADRHLRRLEKWMSCLSSALAYMHSRKILHGDIKPENIIYKGNDICFIDFDVSVDHSVVKWSATANGFSPMYAAPEVQQKFQRWTAELLAPFGFPADIFSLGAVFADMATVISKHLVEDFHRRLSYPSDINETSFSNSLPAVDEWLIRIGQLEPTQLIIQMLSEDPKDRPTARRVLFDLKAIHSFPTCDCMPRPSPP